MLGRLLDLGTALASYLRVEDSCGLFDRRAAIALYAPSLGSTKSPRTPALAFLGPLHATGGEGEAAPAGASSGGPGSQRRRQPGGRRTRQQNKRARGIGVRRKLELLRPRRTCKKIRRKSQLCLPDGSLQHSLSSANGGEEANHNPSFSRARALSGAGSAARPDGAARLGGVGERGVERAGAARAPRQPARAVSGEGGGEQAGAAAG